MADPYVVEVPLRWSDMDAYGHVNNVQYLRLLEDARVIGFREWFPDRPTLLDEGIVVTHHAIEYRAPLTYRPEPVEVDMWVTRVHGAGFDLGYTVRDPASVGTSLYALAETGLALYDFATARPRRLEPGARKALAAHVGEPVTFRRAAR
ncbi:acyl-CoA thioesterase [Phycicoccus avicenniae]|uniref:acyl-CoA thioesterase n=1 Tax=Phycicoccus avicenniae TaxID=2828860 RepID=UPI003D2D5609